MATNKPLSKSQIVSALAEKVGVTKKQANQMLDELAALVYKNAKNTFVLPGLGKIVVANRPAREIVMQIGPKKGQKVKIPAKRVLKFRFAKVAKEAILGKK
ncbi:MAG: HU family DNA-binding protein [Verrucomicrobiia bacterium]|jgi:DNA-binding protein HU-beta